MGNERQYHDRRSPMSPRALIGVFIALIGVALTLDRLGLLDAEYTLRYWSIGVLIVGLLMLTQPSRHARARGVFVTAIGAFFTLQMYRLITISVFQLFWPVMLIVIGLSLAFQSSRRRSRIFRGGPLTDEHMGGGPGPAGGGTSASRLAPATDFDGNMSMFAMWSGCKRAVHGGFRGADITAIMGGADLDLRLAQVPPGGEAVIDIVAIMGGVELAVPYGWIIETPIMPFMGSVEDRRLAPIPVEGAKKETPSRLVIRGFVMMGGVRIKS
jgi:predicted membrane protein